MTQPFRFNLFCFLAFILAKTATGANAEQLIVGGVKLPPIASIDENAQMHGPGVDFVRYYIDQLNQSYRVVGMSQNRLYREISLGKIDITVASKKHSAHDEALFFSARPIMCLRVNIYSRPDLPPIDKLGDLSGFQMLYYYYFEEEDLMKEFLKVPNLSLLKSSNRRSALKMLQLGRADYYLDFALPAGKAQEETQLQLPYLTIFEEPIYLATIRTRDETKALINKINDTLSREPVNTEYISSSESLFMQLNCNGKR